MTKGFKGTIASLAVGSLEYLIVFVLFRQVPAALVELEQQLRVRADKTAEVSLKSLRAFEMLGWDSETGKWTGMGPQNGTWTPKWDMDPKMGHGPQNGRRYIYIYIYIMKGHESSESS